MRALSFFNQLWFIVPVNSWKNRTSSELLHKSNRPQVSMVIGVINEELVNQSPGARDLPILLVFYQHPAWFISL